MLALPTTGFSHSVNSHNVKLDVLCDWIEANVLFDETDISDNDIVDFLVDEHIYDHSDMACIIVSSAWTELRRREAWLSGSSPFKIKRGRITRQSTWIESIGHTFCLLLSFNKWYRDWAKQFGGNYTTQGLLFEKLTKESLDSQFIDWEIYLTGWSREKCTSLKDTVNDIASRLNESTGNIVRWTNEKAKDAGLDLLLYRPFQDGRVGVPVYLMQCASGNDWKTKVHTPNLRTWDHIIEFAAKPRKAFSLPFALLDEDFIKNSQLVDGMLIDRYRILAASKYKENWVSAQLKKELRQWCKPRIDLIPRSE